MVCELLFPDYSSILFSHFSYHTLSFCHIYLFIFCFFYFSSFFSSFFLFFFFLSPTSAQLHQQQSKHSLCFTLRVNIICLHEQIKWNIKICSSYYTGIMFFAPTPHPPNKKKKKKKKKDLILHAKTMHLDKVCQNLFSPDELKLLLALPDAKIKAAYMRIQ